MSEPAKVHHFELGDFALDCGVTLPKARIAYTTYGTLSAGKRQRHRLSDLVRRYRISTSSS